MAGADELKGKQSAADQIMHCLSAAQSNVGQAMQLGAEANPMTANVPVFQRMAEVQKELGAMMLEVSKLRGLR